MRKYAIMLLTALILFSGCSQDTITDSPSITAEEASDTVTPSDAETSTSTQQPTPEQTAEPTPEPTPEPPVFDVDSISSNSLNALVREQDIPDDSTQLILVCAGQKVNRMYLMEKTEIGMWQIVYGPFEVQIGKNGLGKEAEGDGKSPEGVYELGYAFGRDFAPPGTTWSWRTSEHGDIWIEDPDSKYYNMYVQDDTVEEKDWNKYSNLNILAFARALEIRYNPERVPGAGSAIFLHIWISPTKPTNGCTAISKENIETLIAWLDPTSHPVIAQLNHEVIGQGGLVYVSDYAYDIIPDIKFASEDNILGVQLEGYEDNQIITKPDVAQALKKANELLKRYGAKLVVHDAYRPVDAFYQIEEWLKDDEDNKMQETYYKDLDKTAIREEYLKYYSHRLYLRSQVVHVSLSDLYGNPLDMGSEYMVLGEKSAFVSDGLSYEQIYNRELLHDIMIQAGFNSIENQWWKFEFNPFMYDTKFDEIIR